MATDAKSGSLVAIALRRTNEGFGLFFKKNYVNYIFYFFQFQTNKNLEN